MRGETDVFSMTSQDLHNDWVGTIGFGLERLVSRAKVESRLAPYRSDVRINDRVEPTSWEPLLGSGKQAMICTIWPMGRDPHAAVGQP